MFRLSGQQRSIKTVSLFLTELDEVMKRSSEPDFLGLANERLVAVMSAGLLSMELFSRRDAVSHLAYYYSGFSK